MKGFSSFPIWITGSGVISCAGESPEDFWQNSLEGKSGLQAGLGYVTNSEYKINKALKLSLKAAQHAMKIAGWTSLNPDDGLI